MPIPDDIAREVLREIFVESFCAELLSADIYFYEIKADIRDGELDNLEVTSRDEQNLKILNAIPELLDGPSLGLGLRRRINYCSSAVYLLSFVSCQGGLVHERYPAV